MRRLNINQIHYFLAIVKAKSFSEAAYDLFISQSSISKQIKSLEDELGIILFTRKSNQRTLTPAGQVFYRYATTMYEQHKDMLDELDRLKNSLVSTIRIGTIPIIPMYTNFNIGINLAFFNEYYKENSVNFDTYEAPQVDILHNLYNGYTDFAFVRQERIPNLNNFDFQVCSIDRMVIVCNRNHYLASKKTVSLKEAANYQLFLLSKESEVRSLILSAFKEQNLNLKIHGESLKPKIVQGMLTGGHDISILPDNVVDLQTFKQLCVIPLKEKIESRVLLVRLKKPNTSKLNQAFWNFWQDYGNTNLEQITL